MQKVEGRRSIWTALWASQNGQDVTLEDGTRLLQPTIFQPLGLVKIITILGDTRKTNASVRLGVNA